MLISVSSYSANRRSTRTLKFVWCVSGTRGVKWNGMVPGVTSEELYFVFLTTRKLQSSGHFMISSLQQLEGVGHALQVGKREAAAPKC